MALCRSVPPIHIMAVVLGSLEIMLFGGVIFGWHSLVYVYKDTHYFSDLCPAPQGATSSPHPHHYNHNTTTNITALSLLNASTTPTPLTAVSYSVNASLSAAEVAVLFSTSVEPISSSNESAARGRGGNSLQDEGQMSCKERAKAHSQGRGSALCDAQDKQFNLIFSLSTGINGVMSFPSGYLYDIVGTRISRVFSLVSFLVGQVCLIFASPAHPYLLYPGFIGLVYGGYQILLTNLQLSCLIPSLRSTIMSLYSGSYDTSASIFLLFKAAHEGGVSVNTSFVVQASLYVLLFGTTTFFFLPKGRVPFPLTPGYRLRCFLCHKLCGRKTVSLQRDSSSEWRMDPTGSVILSRAASRDFLDQRLGLTETDSKPGLNGDASGERAFRDDAGVDDDGGGGGGDSLAQSEGKMGDRSDDDDDEGDEGAKEQGKDLVSSACVDFSIFDMEIEISPPSSLSESETTLNNYSGNNSKASPQKRTGPEQGAHEVEDMLRRGEKTEAKTFRQVALSPLFLTDLMWISVQRLRSWIFVGMFNTWITQLACGDKALVSHYTSVYAAMQFFGILTAPLSGRLMDRKIKGAERYTDPRDERLHAAIASFVLNSTVSVLLTVCTLIPVLKLQYLTFVLHCLHRSFLYGPNSAFVASAFPNEHFGKLFGVTLTVSALFSMLQYPLFLIIQGPLDGDPLMINVFLLVLMLISYIHPLYIWRYLQSKVAKASST